MSITQDQVVEYIKNLRLSDVKGSSRFSSKSWCRGICTHDGCGFAPVLVVAEKPLKKRLSSTL